MTTQIYGTIAALEFARPMRHGFEDIVEEVDISFQPVGLTRRSLTRDSEDIAIVERDNLRVLLGWLPPADSSGSYFLLLAVGPSPHGDTVTVTPETCGFVKDVLLAHLQSYLSFDTVFHADATQPVSSQLVDVVADILLNDFNADVASNYVRPTSHHSPFDNVNHATDDIWSAFSRPQSARRRPGGQAIQPEADISLPKRLTIYTLGATMLIYTPPVGASLLVYSTLRDMLPQNTLSV